MLVSSRLSIVESPQDSDNKELRRRGFVTKAVQAERRSKLFIFIVLVAYLILTLPLLGRKGADGWSKENFLPLLITHDISCLCTVHWVQ
jgi:hypothetical protein